MQLIKKIFIVLCVLSASFTASSALADSAKSSCQLLESMSAAPQDLQNLPLRPGQVIFIAEQHDSKEHHRNQELILDELARRQSPTSVGMEFLSFDQQSAVDDFVQSKIDEPTFLQKVQWGSIPFDFYRYAFFFPKDNGGSMRAINAPRALTRKISQNGLSSLTPDEQKQMPPSFSLGNTLYRERFEQAMGGHVPPQKIDNYFAAQSVWDDTMAWQIESFMRANSSQTLVVLVGDFHVAYEGGLPYQLRKRGWNDIVSITQVNIEGLTKPEVEQLTQPDPKFGLRSDYVWLTEPGCHSL